MSRKPPVFCRGGLLVAMESLSKSQLIDLVMDLACGELGEDTEDESVLYWVQQRLNTVLVHRGDRPVNLAAAYDTYKGFR